MARRRTKAAKQAQSLLDWLESLELPTRVINALRRDLEVVTGEREGEDGAGVLAGLDQAQFTEELYRPRGGQIGKVPTVAKGAIDALRAAIPAPVSDDSIEAAPLAQDSELASDAPKSAALTPSEETPADAAPERIEAMQEATPEVTAASPADAQEEAPDGASEVVVEAAEPPGDRAPEDAPEPAEAPAPPKRRGRPPRLAAGAADASEPAEAPTASPKRRGRPPRDKAASETAAELPPRTRRARVTAALNASQQVTAPAAPVPTSAPVERPPDPSFVALLKLWRELHPQGQRAAMHYMAGLLVLQREML